MPAVLDVPETITKARAVRLLRIGNRTLDAWIRDGRVRELRLPDAHPRVFVEDIKKVLEAATPQ